MALQQQGVRTYRFTGISSAMGSLMPVSILFAESPLAVNVPRDPNGTSCAVGSRQL